MSFDSIESLVKAIDVMEGRLMSTGAGDNAALLPKGRSVDEKTVFPDKQMCILFALVSDAYYKLWETQRELQSNTQLLSNEHNHASTNKNTDHHTNNVINPHSSLMPKQSEISDQYLDTLRSRSLTAAKNCVIGSAKYCEIVDRKYWYYHAQIHQLNMIHYYCLIRVFV